VKRRYDPERHHRRSIRLGGYDYSQPGAYFVTICTRERELLFGEASEGRMFLNAHGQLVAECWSWLSRRYPYVNLDARVVMPNHLHGILVITDSNAVYGRGASRSAPTQHAPVRRKTLGRLIGAFKTISTKRINAARGTAGARVWQRNYYEHIIRNQRELDALRGYIRANPCRWADDPDNPKRW